MRLPPGITGFGAAVNVTAKSTAAAVDTHTENSEVLPEGSVAVAVTGVKVPPKVTLMSPLPLPSVVTARVPMSCCPSPNPAALHDALEKNCKVKFVFGVLLSEPCMIVPPSEFVTDVKTGKF